MIKEEKKTFAPPYHGHVLSITQIANFYALPDKRSLVNTLGGIERIKEKKPDLADFIASGKRNLYHTLVNDIIELMGGHWKE